MKAKLKHQFRQNKLLKVALEKNNEQVQELNDIIQTQPRSKSKFELYNELKIENEIQKIVTEGATPLDLGVSILIFSFLRVNIIKQVHITKSQQT